MNTSGNVNSCSPRQTHYRHCGEFFTPSLNIPVSKESIVIDALDESDSESMNTFLVLLEPYITAQDDDSGQSVAEDSKRHIKWLLTSRNDLRIKQPLTGSLDISLEENSFHVDEIVLNFIDYMVK